MAYIDKPAPRLTKVLADLIPSDPPKVKEWMELRYQRLAGRGYFEGQLSPITTLTFQKDLDNGNFLVVVRLPWLGSVLKFQMGLTPACCAMSFMYSFSVWNDGETCGFSEEEFDKILTAALYEMYQYGMFSSRRIILNMVEIGRKEADPLKVMRPVEDPIINYKPFWTYFHKHAAKVNTMLMPNANTGRIIHHMEVLFDPSFFKE